MIAGQLAFCVVPPAASAAAASRSIGFVLHSAVTVLSKLAMTLLVAAAGGFAFDRLGMPAPWLTGSTVAVGLAAVAGVGIGVPGWLRHCSMIFLGTIMGNAVTPETFAQLPTWPISLSGLLVVVLAMMFAVSVYLERVHGFDPVTARLACIPGNSAYVLALTEESTANAQQVVMVQMMRLAVLLTCLPFVFDALGYVVVARPDDGDLSAAAIQSLVLLFVAGAAGGLFFNWIGFPAGSMCGAMFAGAICSGSGTISVQVPDDLLIPGFAVMGAVCGANFAGADRRSLAAMLAASVGAVVVGTIVALAVAAPVAWLMGVSTAQVWLAYAPGGADTMSILALALGLEPTFVVSHHVIRMFGLGIVVPAWLRFYAPARETNTRGDEI